MSVMSRDEVESLIQEVLEVYPEKAKKDRTKHLTPNDHEVEQSKKCITSNKKSSPPAGALPSSTAPLTDAFRSSTSPSAAPSKKPSSIPTSPVSNVKVPWRTLWALPLLDKLFHRTFRKDDF